jgi:hypothetical protein
MEEGINMVHKTSIIPGLSKFVDNVILSHYSPTSMKRIVVAGGISLYLKQNQSMIDTLSSNPLVQGLGIVSEDGMVDIDAIREVIKSEIAKAGFMRVNIPIIGDVDFTSDDIDSLYRYILNQDNSQVS